MKTIVSLPERIFKEAERIARKLRKSRSRLYAEAISEYLARHAPNEITESMNLVCDKLGKVDDQFQARSAHRILAKDLW
jgi:metal-responsive CopG/Arc/MetJ family transcriptional regulator